MNEYGAMAQRHWQTWLPSTYAKIPDPEAFFTSLGEEVIKEIEERGRALAGADLPDETYPTKLGRLATARQRAEACVLRERVLLRPEVEGGHEDPPITSGDDRDSVRGDSTHPFWRQLRQDADAGPEADR